MEFLQSLNFEQLSQSELHVLLLWIAAAGALYAFAGYKLFRFVLALTGFGLAGAVAAAIGGFLGQGDLIIMGVCALIGGIAGACALFFLYRSGVFCLGCLGAFVLAWQGLSGNDAAWAPWAIFGIALAGGLLALLLERPAMTIATSVIGGWLVAAALGIYLLGPGAADEFRARSLDIPSDKQWILLGVWVLVSFAGLMVQFRMGRSKKE